MARKRLSPAKSSRNAGEEHPNVGCGELQGTKKDAVRNYLQEHPTAKNAEVAEALNQKGVEISEAYVATIKTGLNKEQAKAKTGDAPAEVDPANAKIEAAAALLKIAGSVEAGYAALKTAQSIRDTFEA